MDEQDDASPAGWADAPAIGRVVVRRNNGSERPVEFDMALWVERNGERGYIIGNAHTHRGRFHVCFPDAGYATPMSVYELTAVSAESRYWLTGFLTGYEPTIAKYLGRDGSEEYDPTDEEWVRYRRFIERYLKRGSHIRLHMRPNRALVITDEERAEIRLDDWRPWTYVGERVLIAAGAEWVDADPQPQMDGSMMAGSICAERDHHDVMSLESDWSVCCDCGEVTVYR